MLVLSAWGVGNKRHEPFFITVPPSDQPTVLGVTVLEVKGGTRVLVGFDVPDEVEVDRQSVAISKQREARGESL